LRYGRRDADVAPQLDLVVVAHVLAVDEHGAPLHVVEAAHQAD